MSIEIKNYGEIRYNTYESLFNTIPARYLIQDFSYPSAVPHSGDIKAEITRFLADVMNTADSGTYTLAKSDLDNMVWSNKMADGTTDNPHYDGSKTEAGVKEWEKATRLVKEYLEKKVA